MLWLMWGNLCPFGCGSMHPSESESIGAVLLCSTPGEPGCGLICSMFPSSTAAAASQPALSPHTPFGVLIQWALLGAGLGSVGYRSQMDRWWGLLLSICLWTGRRGEGDRCGFVPLVELISTQDTCPMILKEDKKRGKDKGKKRRGLSKGQNDVTENVSEKFLTAN